MKPKSKSFEFALSCAGGSDLSLSKKKQKCLADLVNAFNGLSSNCSDSSLKMETQVVHLAHNFVAMVEEFQAMKNQTNQIKAMENQITVLTDKLERVETMVGSLARREIPVEEITGLQRSIKELNDNVMRCTQAMLADHAKLGET